MNGPFKRVGWIGGQTPYDDPSYIPNDPHNIPNQADLVRRNTGPQYLGEIPSAGGAPGTGEVFNIRDLHHYARVISSYVPVPNSAAGEASSLILYASNVRRNFLSFRNSSTTANVYVDFGVQASQFSFLLLAPNQIVLFDVVVPQDDIYVIADAASAFVSFGYSTILG